MATELPRRGDPDTDGSGGKFPETTRGLLDDLQQSGRALQTLSHRYWKPIYALIRARWAKSPAEAKDLTQEFFAWLLGREGQVLARYQRERAQFRIFLRALVRGFLSDQQKAEGRIKRGGDAVIVPFDGDERSLDGIVADHDATDPDGAFDRAWAMTLVASAIDAVKHRLEAEGRGAQFRVFEEHDLRDGGAASYAEVAERLGLKDSQVRDALSAVRRKVRAEMRVQLAAQTLTDEQFEEEWRALMGA